VPVVGGKQPFARECGLMAGVKTCIDSLSGLILSAFYESNNLYMTKNARAVAGMTRRPEAVEILMPLPGVY